MSERIDRPINVEKMTDEQLETAIVKLSNKITTDVDAVCERANELLKRYGLSCKMQIVIEQLNLDDTTKNHDKIET